jgi:Xaa-Pro aminopeptidase
MQKAIKISDIKHYAILANVKPDMSEEEVANKAVAVLGSHNVSDRIILIHSHPETTYPDWPGPTINEKTHPLTLSPEFTRRKGYGAQMIRAY